MTNPLGIGDEFVTQRPSGLREMLFGGRLPHTKVTLSGVCWGHIEGTTLALRSLPAGAQVEALGLALEWLTKKAHLERTDIYGSEGGDGSLENVTRAVILSRALLDPSTLKPLCKDVSDVLGRASDDGEDDCPGFTAAQITWLFNEWDRFQSARSPFVAMTAKAVEEHVSALGKGLIQQTSWRSFDRATLEATATLLAETLAKQTTPSSTATSSPTSSGASSNNG